MQTEDLAGFVRGIPQIVPERWCRDCRICCRFPDVSVQRSPATRGFPEVSVQRSPATRGFPDSEDVQSPTWSRMEAIWLAASPEGVPSWLEERQGSASLHPALRRCSADCHCPAFSHETNRCDIYANRPLDCRLYPFVLARHPGGGVTLAMDEKCPYIRAQGADAAVAAYAETLRRSLDSGWARRYLEENPDAAGDFRPEFVSVAALPAGAGPQARGGDPPHPALQPIPSAEWGVLQERLWKGRHRYSGYTVASLWGWSDLIRVWRAELEGGLCLFCEQAGGFFMPLPPLGGPITHRVLGAAWRLLQELNRGSAVSRIEGWEPDQRIRANDAEILWREDEREYLYRIQDLVELRGKRYRSQRWAIHRCRRENQTLFRSLADRDLEACLRLHAHWAIQRQRAHPDDRHFRALVRDGLFFHRRLLMGCRQFGWLGRVIEVEGQIRGYTLGVAVSPEVCCVFLEIADRAVPGLAQLLFYEFCRQQQGRFSWVNAMGDMGLAGLRRAKEGYRPAEGLPVFTLVELAGVEPATS